MTPLDWKDVPLFDGAPVRRETDIPVVGSIVFNPAPRTSAPALDGVPKPTPQQWAAWEDLREDVERQRYLRDRPHAAMKPLANVRIIGFGHKARSGKNHLANVIHSRYPLTTERYAFADAIKTFCRVHYGMTTKDAPLLQKVGTDVRQRDPETWIRALYWQIAEAQPPIALITDVRMKDEAKWIKDLGGELIDVQRFNPDGSRYVDPTRDPNHITETDLDGYPFDHVLTNNGTTSEFAAAGLDWYEAHSR